MILETFDEIREAIETELLRNDVNMRKIIAENQSREATDYEMNRHHDMIRRLVSDLHILHLEQRLGIRDCGKRTRCSNGNLRSTEAIEGLTTPLDRR